MPSPPEAHTARKLALQIIEHEARAQRLILLDRGLNLDHERRLLFVHNPKAMGTSLKSWLGLPTDNADHRFPTLMVSRDTWQRYTTLVVVRHPIDRFVSSFHFHCRSDYGGGYLQKHPSLKSWDMAGYFEQMVRHEPLVLAPQWKYTQHLLSEAPPDLLVRMGPDGADLEPVRACLGLSGVPPELNRASGPKALPDPHLLARLVHYYRRDFEQFGYPLPS